MKRGWVWWLALALALSACAQPEAALPVETVTISIAGSTGMTPVLGALTGEFSRRHPQVLFSVRGGGSTLGEQWAAAGQVDLAASTLLPPELATHSQARQDLVRIPIGVDGLAVIVHPRNHVAVLTLLQLRDLFSGHLLTWQEVGAAPGGDGAVLLISREDGSGARLFFEAQVMGDEGVALTAVIMPTSRDVVDYVASQPAAIGYVSAAYVRDAQGALLGAEPLPADGPSGPERPSARVRIVPVEGFFPTLDVLRQQGYHLAHPLFLVSREEPQGWVREFVDFTLSPAGQQIVARFHAPIR